MGSLAAGGAAALGTGATTQVQSNRAVNLTVEGDKNGAYTGFAPVGSNYDALYNESEYIGYDQEGHLRIRLKKLNSDSRSDFLYLFKLQNNAKSSDAPNRYWFENWASSTFDFGSTYTSGQNYSIGSGSKYESPEGRPRIAWVYSTSKDGSWDGLLNDLANEDGNSVEISPGQEVYVGLITDTRNGQTEFYDGDVLVRRVIIHSEEAGHNP
jgi:hypothetical protein